MKKGDRVFACMGLGLSLWLILESTRLVYRTAFAPGPGFHPFWLGIILGVLSISLLVQTFRVKKDAGDAGKEKPRLPGKASLGRLGLILLITLAFAFLINTLGFVLAAFLFVASLLYILEGDGVLKSVFYGIVFSGSVFLIFQYWLEVNLPKGFLGF